MFQCPIQHNLVQKTGRKRTEYNSEYQRLKWDEIINGAFRLLYSTLFFAPSVRNDTDH